jgi:hypothetical protein
MSDTPASGNTEHSSTGAFAAPAPETPEAPEKDFATPFLSDGFLDAPGTEAVPTVAPTVDTGGVTPFTLPNESAAKEPAAAATELGKQGFVDIITSGSEDKATDDDGAVLDDRDGPPAFYKEYTQGFSKPKAEEIAAAEQEAKTVEAKEVLPEFLTAYDTEQLGKTESEIALGSTPGKGDKDSQGGAKVKKANEQKKAESNRTALSVIITILIVILVIVVACIIVLKLLPDSLGAYYIQDFIETIQSKLGIGNGA